MFRVGEPVQGDRSNIIVFELKISALIKNQCSRSIFLFIQDLNNENIQILGIIMSAIQMVHTI